MSRIRKLALIVHSVLALALPAGTSAQEEGADRDGEAAASESHAGAEARSPTPEEEALARQVFETGRMYFDRAEYERAMEAFREAYRLSGRAVLLVNVARALEALGRDEEAIATLEQALAEDESLESLAAPRLNRLRAQAQRRGRASDEPPPSEPDTRPAESSEGAVFWAGVVTSSVGAALLAVSIGTGVASNDIYGDLQQSCPGGVCAPERQADIDRGQSLAIASTATLAIGGAAAAAGVVMMLLDLASSETAVESGPGVEVTGGPGAAGVGLRARF